MKDYPSIPSSSEVEREACLAFYKYDGSNLRFEWSKKRGWHKFGTRNRLFDETDEVFGCAIKIFNETVAPFIDPILRKEYREAQEIVAYCEFFGDESFSGQHKADDLTKRLVMFDVNIHKRGFIEPRQFYKLFKDFPFAAKLVYDGILDDEFIERVRNNTLDTPLNEGIICKGGTKHDRWMCKIKTNHYLTKLKEVYADGWQSYWE
jgi:hypothetical protein